MSTMDFYNNFDELFRDNSSVDIALTESAQSDDLLGFKKNELEPEVQYIPENEEDLIQYHILGHSDANIQSTGTFNGVQAQNVTQESSYEGVNAYNSQATSDDHNAFVTFDHEESQYQNLKK